jgi:uncharacterized protein YjbI with pentapeptide repeats
MISGLIVKKGLISTNVNVSDATAIGNKLSTNKFSNNMFSNNKLSHNKLSHDKLSEYKLSRKNLSNDKLYGNNLPYILFFLLHLHHSPSLPYRSTKQIDLLREVTKMKFLRKWTTRQKLMLV